MRRNIALSLSVAAGMTLSAQQPPSAGTEPAIALHDIVVAAPAGGSASANMQFFSAGEVLGPVLKGQPYTAEAVTEMTRVLADGTRIVNKNSSTMARDKDGRTRRDNTLSNIGPWAAGNQQPPKLATIADPVAKETIMLDLNARTARRMKTPANLPPPPAAGSRDVVFERKVHVVVEGKGEAAIAEGGVAGIPALPPAGGAMAVWHHSDARNAKRESLGRQNMEGVMVDGTRETATVPAGEIGNDRPIVTVTERWYSPELQMVIYSKTTDPQFGETVYRVTNLRRGEPNADLFKVPADFKVSEGPAIPSTRIMRRDQ